jgi:hypothetical protein
MSQAYADLWAEVQAVIRPQMTQAAYDAVVAGTRLDPESSNGHYRVLAPTEMAREWLENRLKVVVAKALEFAVRHPVEVEFALGEATPLPPLEPAPPAEAIVPADLPAEEAPAEATAPTGPPAEALTPGQIVARADYIRGFLEGDRANKIKPAGYSQVPHHTTFFHLPELGPAYGLLKILDSKDKRALKDVAPNYWTPPARYSFQELAEKLNHAHHRFISGDTYECDYSRQRRKERRPLASTEECCHSPNYEWLRYKQHSGGGLACLHWVVGQLEVLHRVGLARIEIRPREYKPLVQVWRMPPVITPYQYRGLTPQLQSDFDAWLIEYGHLFNIPHLDFWRAITEPYLAPLMPGYTSWEIEDNWLDQYRKRRNFFDHALRNPAYGREEEDLT